MGSSERLGEREGEPPWLAGARIFNRKAHELAADPITCRRQLDSRKDLTGE